MTSRQLAAHGRRYMRLLDMSEWVQKAEFRIVKGLKHPDGEAVVGLSWWHPEERTSVILVEQDQPEDEKHQTLIHEIYHVLLEGHKTMVKKPYDASYELAINRASEAHWRAWTAG